MSPARHAAAVADLTWEQAIARARWLAVLTGKRWRVKRTISGRWTCVPTSWPDLHADLFRLHQDGVPA